MLLLRALLLWALVSVNLVGGAILFRRLYGREAPWFGFVVPALALCVGLNFIEHFVAVPSLLGLLPLTTVGSILLLARPNVAWGFWRTRKPVTGFAVPKKAVEPAEERLAAWRDLRLPGGIFLGLFAFTFFVCCLDPSILASSDGLADLNLVANFCQGETVPPIDGWLPPFRLESYYTFQHYAASVLTRLIGVDVGTGCNVSHALLAAFIGFAASAAAWRITGRAWIAILMAVVLEGAATGSSAYLLLTEKDPSPWVMSNLSGGLENHDANPIWKLLATAPFRERLELQVPGIWTWRDEYHPNAGGDFLCLCALWVLAGLLQKERQNWPWIGAALIPFLAIVTSTWALPLTGLLCGGGLVVAWRSRIRPENGLFVAGAVGLGLVCLWPSLLALFSSPEAPPIMWTRREWRTPLYEFLIQWWPVYLPWLALFFGWRKLPPAVKWAQIVVPLMLVGIELITVEDGRYNTIEKMWGYTFGVGLVAFFPAVAARRGIGSRLVTGLIVLSSVIAFAGWLRGAFRWADWQNNAFRLSGDLILRDDAQRDRLLQTLIPLHRATLLTGKVDWDYYDSPALAVFSGNRDFVAWTFSEERYGHKAESDLRATEVNDFYAGKTPDPLPFLQEHAIAAVVIWPDDDISDAQLATFRQQLAPRYTYVDGKGDGPHNAGVFLRQNAAP
jgi:hypothetical protein